MADDVLDQLIHQHAEVSEWAHVLEQSTRAFVEAGGALDVDGAERFFRDNVHDHFLYEETRIFPAILSTKPDQAVCALIEQLRAEHIHLMEATGELFVDLAMAIAREASEAEWLGLADRTRGLVQVLLAHATLEDAQLIPYLTEHREAIQAYLASHAPLGEPVLMG